MSWWEHLIGERALAVGKAVLLARQLTEEGVGDDVAIARLQAMPGRREDLQRAAELSSSRASKGYPGSRARRLLLAAAADDPNLARPSTELAKIEARQRQLWDQPAAVSFGQIADGMPALRVVERRALQDPMSFVRGLSFRESGQVGNSLPRKPLDRSNRITTGIKKIVATMVGPASGNPDPVLSSDTAYIVVVRHLRKVANAEFRPTGRFHPK